MPDLETVDVADVEILSAGGPVHGVGSPPEGDFWSKDDLELIAAANRELASELKPPSKIGHSAAQALLQNGVTPGEEPAVGWLDGSTFRVEERDGVAKLVADVKDVPKKFAELLDAHAYSARSVELSKVTSQASGKVYDWCVSGLAWLGAKLPAVRTLDDIVALYEHEELDKPNAKVFVVYATGDVIWDPEAGFEDLRDDINEALNGPYTGGMNGPRFWVADIAIAGDKALVQDYYDDGSDGWVIPFTRADDDSITIAPSSDWVTVERGWVEAARELSEKHVPSFSPRADIRPVPTETKKYSDEQRKAFAEATGLEEEKVTDELLAKAGVAVEGEEPATEPKVDPAKQLEADERLRKYEERADAAEKRAERIERRLFEQDREVFVERVLRDGKATPGQRADIEAMYEESPEKTRKFFENAPANDEWARSFGVDSEEITDEQREAEEKSYAEETAARLQIPVEQVL